MLKWLVLLYEISNKPELYTAICFSTSLGIGLGY